MYYGYIMCLHQALIIMCMDHAEMANINLSYVTMDQD